ncbi:BREX-1 system adenine-specific DNA-methyltransferase PglX [Listeria seeligeri]|uniref:BREX-1 system adenine-specific DNA-methyltransferase PglX n=1 Tax=Listeria seeligeri TaxID=1640 RepID=UPI0016282E3C|nr:BREX-1 system adenine-specific DNA-methyltransferase PglX [Listeria seeligeri]MBC1753783.1 BREX-1 system adenine-specific DNA-methyltransferase PglX [Listeria seeligeri]MBC1787313.1 BREX-1 system adenine-specific DNA-methyltransferase PglX [Listeria seeligeri]MBC2233607.1 BREX-1 system adenine-specific DNA-methyltransferase PglX [Listeria seeligeri]MBT0132396.1 BREX-1 system adenine-specific DNA-methyltransferase PglX [Listeria seeligeri]
MDKKAIRKFAIEARRKLIEGVSNQAYKLGIKESKIDSFKAYEGKVMINGEVYDATLYKQLLRRVATEGYKETIEKIAYTWFNRFIALRYMEVNNFLPSKISIFSSSNNSMEPDALSQVLELIDILALNRELVNELLDKNNYQELYRHIFIQQCRQLELYIPNMFEKIESDFVVLLPKGLLNKDSIIRDLVEYIPVEDWSNTEILGWLYQFYISEEKDNVFKNLKKGKKIEPENIPAATQLFTPKWIVQYLVDNSLGRIGNETVNDTEFTSYSPYYIKEAKQSYIVDNILEKLKEQNLPPTKIKIIDPCMGSGHILTYSFEVLVKIYKRLGYTSREIPPLILENNLFGLEIDDRAAQIASFSLIMKAREYSRYIFEEKVAINVVAFQNSTNISVNAINIIGETDTKVDNVLNCLITLFKNAKTLGSIIKVPTLDVEILEERLTELEKNGSEDIFLWETLEYDMPIIKSLIKQYSLLSQEYEVVVTNPPYMGSKGMNEQLLQYVRVNYPDSKMDLFSIFMEVMTNLSKKNYYIGAINQHSWMFLSSFEKLRKKLLANQSIENMLHLGTRTFEEIGGEVVQNTAYILRNVAINNYKGTYVRLVDVKNAEAKKERFLTGNDRYIAEQNSMQKIPGNPIAYWVSETLLDIFQNQNVADFGKASEGIKTGNNKRFLRRWHEISTKNFSVTGQTEFSKWFPHHKGGEFRKWYGNNIWVINWNLDGKEIKMSSNSGVQGEKIRSNINIGWSKITTKGLSLRKLPANSFFDSGSPSFYSKNNLNYFLAFFNSKVAKQILEITNPSINFQVGDIEKLPIIFGKTENVETLVKENIKLAKKDWDSFENSWEFQKHPLIANKTIKQAFQKWENESIENFNRVKSNEEELNKIFIHLYNLQNELTPEVPEEEVTIRKANQLREVKSLLSYLIGLIFGRYSLDQPGIFYAGGEWDASKYSSFQPDEDNIIPFTEENYFEDDIILRVEYLLTLIYSEETLEENLDYIANTLELKKNETSRERIRRYFLKEFYQDHLKIYQKRPIYWMITSGKKGAFKGLIYLHRYHCDTLAQIRTDYILPLIKTMDNLMSLEKALIDDLEIEQKNKITAQKNWEKLALRQDEVKDFSKVIDHMANKRIQLELDDGVILNHAKFQNIDIDKGVGNLFERINR